MYHPSAGTLSTAPKREKAPSALMAFFKSDLFKLIEQQLATMLMVYVTKMIEQQMKAPEEQPVLVEQAAIEGMVPVEPQADLNAPAPQY